MPDTTLDDMSCVVTVTYGKRWHLLRQCLVAARTEGVARAIVVDNGAQENIRELAMAEFGDFSDVVHIGRNSGSAGGFKAGLERALASGIGFVLMLDDDNRPEPGALAHLRAAYADSVGRVPRESLAMLAYRPAAWRHIVPLFSASA